MACVRRSTGVRLDLVQALSHRTGPSRDQLFAFLSAVLLNESVDRPWIIVTGGMPENPRAYTLRLFQ
jgi:hypothetical protein